jgi:hypothetical protein
MAHDWHNWVVEESDDFYDILDSNPEKAEEIRELISIMYPNQNAKRYF